MKIGIFDSGLGGLSILREIRSTLPEYDYLYLGDNARAPYGTRSYDVIYEYTLQAVRYLAAQGCRLIILACNTASAKALRTIQQRDIHPDELRVLGVIRPTVESVTTDAPAQHIGILATPGTVNSDSYTIELSKINPAIHVSQQACPMWVPLIENGEKDSPATTYFVDKYMCALYRQDPNIDTVLLGCTHYPLIREQIEDWLQTHHLTARVVGQGKLVAESLKDYLRRHTDIESALHRGGTCSYLTTESVARFQEGAQLFLNEEVEVQHVELNELTY